MAPAWSPGQPWPGTVAPGQAAPSQGWSLNPLTDVQKATSGIGDWINQHTGIGGFNPGIGSAVSTIGGIIPGLANLGIAAATPWNETSQNRLGQAAQGFAHGLQDTGTDIATVGGLAPWTNTVESTIGDVTGYTPTSLKQYATQKGGPGLLGAGLNDFANLAMGAGAVAKFAKAGELGEAATAAQAADRAAQLQHAAEGNLPGDVAAKGAQARLEAAQTATEGTNTAPETVLERAKLLDRLHTVQQGADYAFNPLRAWQALGAPLGRAAVLDAVPEAGIDTQAGRVAQEAGQTPQTATQGVSEHPVEMRSEQAPVSPTGPVPPVESELERLAREASAHEEAKTAGNTATLAEQPAPGMVRLYRGQPLDPNVPVGMDNWTSTPVEAASHAAASGGQVIATDVPAAVAEQAHAAAQAAGDFGTSNTVHHIPAEYADAARPVEAAKPARGAPGITFTERRVGANEATPNLGGTHILEAKNAAGEHVGFVEYGKAESGVQPGIGTHRIFNLDVEDAYHRQGIARAMLDHLAAENVYGKAGIERGTPPTAAGQAFWDAWKGSPLEAPSPVAASAPATAPGQTTQTSPVQTMERVQEQAPVVKAVEAYRRARDFGPQEANINLARARRVPDWATKIVGHLPEFAKTALRAMEYRGQGHQVATVINEAGRTFRMQQAAEMRQPWFKAHVAAAQNLIGVEDSLGNKISPDQADRIVGERVHAALTAGPVWHEMEAVASQLNAIEPNAVEKALGLRGRLSAEANTPEFRQQIQDVADLFSQRIAGKEEFARTSPYLGDRGLPADQNKVQLTSDQKAMLQKAVKAKLDAMNLEPKARAEAEAALEQIAQHQENAGQAYENMTTARAAAAEAMNRLVEARYGPRILENDKGEVVPGKEANANLSAKQMSSSGTGLEGDTAQEAYQRGQKAKQAQEDYQAAQDKERAAYATMLDAHKNVLDLQDRIANASLPSQMASAALHGKSDLLLTRLQDQINNATVARVPPVYQPVVRAALEIARMTKEHPELADVLADVPKNFAEAVAKFHEQGFDPTHISEMTEEKARRFAMGSSILSPDLGKQEIGGFRKGRTGALASAGLDSRTASGLAAQMASVLHEDRVNAIADHVDRLYAIPAPKNEFGERYNPNPRELTWWDQRRRGLLSTMRPESAGMEQGIQGTQLIPKSVARVIDAYSKDHSNMLQRALAKATNPWRALVLTLSPKFYVNHMVGHMILGGVQGVSLPQWWAAFKEARSGFAHFPELAKQGIYEREVGMPSSVIPYTGVKQAVATDGVVGGVREMQAHLNNAVNTVDSMAKVALALKAMSKGVDRDAALHFAQQAGVDYAALSPFERQVVRSLIPFYSFEKGVLKIVMQYPLDHPVAANVLMQVGRMQQHWAVDSQGNPLPSAYQDIIKVPGLGNVNFKNMTPFKDVSSLVTVSGLVNSLQFAVKAGIQTGLGVAPPGVKAGVKVGPTGNLVPDVPLLPTLANSLNATPQGALLSGLGKNPAQAAESFAGIPTVDQATLDKAGQKNAVATGETQLPLSTQQKATAFPVDQSALQNALNAQVQANGGVASPSPLPIQPGGTTPTPEQIGAATTTANTARLTKAASTRAAKKAAGAPTIRKPRNRKLRQRIGRAHNGRRR